MCQSRHATTRTSHRKILLNRTLSKPPAGEQEANRQQSLRRSIDDILEAKKNPLDCAKHAMYNVIEKNFDQPDVATLPRPTILDFGTRK
jgi:hypothetical protein